MGHKEGAGMTGKNHKEETKLTQSEKMKGHFNAEKWTEELVCETLDKMMELLDEEQDVISKTKTKTGVKGDYNFEEVCEEKVSRRLHTKTSLLRALKIRNTDWFNDMAAKFADNETICRTIKAISDFCKDNIIVDAENGVTNSGIASLMLQNDYDWKNKNDNTNNNNNNNRNLDIELPEADEEAKRRWEQSQVKDDE